jgi:Ion channel
MFISTVVVGIGLIFIVLLDAFETVVLPRRITNPLRVTWLFYRLTWAPWSAIGRRIKSERKRENFLGFFGPLSLIMLLGVWAVGLVIGFALLHQAADENRAASTWHYLYFSGTTFFTLGLGDVVPTIPADRIVTVIEGGIGFSFLGLVIGYLPMLYQAFSRREVNISLLDARAGSPPTAVEFLRRHCDNGQSRSSLEQFFADWERWAAELLESHLSYPVLGQFRSQHENESWVAALTMLLDASALVMAAFEGSVAHSANLTFAIARHAAVDLSQVYYTAPRPAHADRLLPAALAQVRELLPGGMTVNEEKLTELRNLYEPYVTALSDFLLMPLPTWTTVETVGDNWQTTAWKQIDGVTRGRSGRP